MASSSHTTAFSVPAVVEQFRDADGFLPMLPCSKCGTKIVGRVSQKPRSKGKRLYKCPLLEHTDFACGTYMFEEQYVDYLVLQGTLPRACSALRGPGAPALEMVRSGNTMVPVAAEDVQSNMVQAALEARMKVVLENQGILSSKVDRIGERLVFIGLANLVVVVLVLMILVFKA